MSGISLFPLIPTTHQERDHVCFFRKLPINIEAPLAFIFLDVLQDFVGASSAELRAESQVGRSTPDGPDLGRKFKVGFLLSSHV